MANRPVATLTVFRGSGVLMGYSSWITFPVDERVTEDQRQQIGRLPGAKLVKAEAQDAVLVVFMRRMPTPGFAEVIGIQLSLDVGVVLDRQYDWDMQPFPAAMSTTVLPGSGVVLFDTDPVPHAHDPSLLRRALEWLLELLMLQPLKLWSMSRMINRIHPRRQS